MHYICTHAKPNLRKINGIVVGIVQDMTTFFLHGRGSYAVVDSSPRTERLQPCLYAQVSLRSAAQGKQKRKEVKISRNSDARRLVSH